MKVFLLIILVIENYSNNNTYIKTISPQPSYTTVAYIKNGIESIVIHKKYNYSVKLVIYSIQEYISIDLVKIYILRIKTIIDPNNTFINQNKILHF